jgi:acetate kinase
MIILVINCGSSSIKYQLLDMKSDDVYDLLAKGIAEKIGLDMGRLQHSVTGKDKYIVDVPIPRSQGWNENGSGCFGGQGSRSPQIA